MGSWDGPGGFACKKDPDYVKRRLGDLRSALVDLGMDGSYFDRKVLVVGDDHHVVGLAVLFLRKGSEYPEIRTNP